MDTGALSVEGSMAGLSKKSVARAWLWAGFLAVVASCGMGGRGAAGPPPMSLKALFAYCGIPSACRGTPAWEGRKVIFRGYADPDRMVDKRRYPRLPYEKFLVVDRQGRSIEVWVDLPDSGPLFDRLAKRTDTELTVRGRLAAVRLPASGGCRMTAKAWLDDPADIQ
jgi:hypothetical protein